MSSFGIPGSSLCSSLPGLPSPPASIGRPNPAALLFCCPRSPGAAATHRHTLKTSRGRRLASSLTPPLRVPWHPRSSPTSLPPSPSSAASQRVLLPRVSFLRQGLLGLLGGMAGAWQWIPRLLPHSSAYPDGDAASAAPSTRTSQITEALEKAEWPKEFPFRAEDFQRYDESPDAVFYSMPRFVTHIDDAAIRALTKYYTSALPPPNTPGVAVLDMCSSWISHYPKGYRQEKIVGLGMNEDELKRNPVLTEYVVRDLNKDPSLPFPDNSFDAITNAVSVDYLSRPLEVFREMQRILKPGGLAAMSFSNRCFWTKAIQMWTSTGDVDHVLIVGAYFHYAGGFEAPQALDISPNPGRTDPMYVVFSRKLAEA